jgi:acetamidase/formamidase
MDEKKVCWSGSGHSRLETSSAMSGHVRSSFETGPLGRARTATSNVAMKNAVREAIELLQEKAGVTAAEAYAIASMGVDFRVAEAVDSVQLIYGVVPKRFFKQNPGYWTNK